MILRRPSFPVSIAIALSLATTIARADPPHLASSIPAASMSGVRWLHRQIPLKDGRVLVLGGAGGTSAETAEVYDPATNTWTPTPPMLFSHNWPVASEMCDGRVIVTGRIDANFRSAEIYDPVANAWIDAGTMKYSHLYGTATLLADCRVLFVGGYSANTHAEIYDPAKGVFFSVGPMHNERFFHSTVALPDGSALVAGGGVDINGAWFDRATVDLLDPVTGTWKKVKSMHAPRRAHTATLLPDGRVLVAGGTTGGQADGTQGGKQLATAEIYNLATDTWDKVEPGLNTARTFHTASLLPSGAVLLFGGRDATGSATSSIEGFFAGQWQILPPMLADRYLHGSTVLPDGRVLVTGGVHQATTEIYALTDLGGACESDLQCAAGHCVGGLCCDEACDTGCRRCDLPDALGTCTRACDGSNHAQVCPDGSSTCPNDACIQDSCEEYLCSATSGACLEECQSVADCAPGYACDLDRRCVPPPDVSSADPESCAVPTAPDRAPLALPAISTALALLFALRRRRRRPD